MLVKLTTYPPLSIYLAMCGDAVCFVLHMLHSIYAAAFLYYAACCGEIGHVLWREQGIRTDL